MHIPWALQQSIGPIMDSLVDLNDASKALDLDRIRYQLMSVPVVYPDVLQNR